MKETGTHREAFEYYYNLGDERTSQKVADQFSVSRRSIEEWKSNFNWKERVEKRDIVIMEEIERKMSKSIIQEKLEYHQSISTNIKLLRAIIGTIVSKIQNKEIEIKNLGDYNAILNSFEKMIRLDLFLLGEPDKLLLKFKGDISVKQQNVVDKLVKGLTDEQLTNYITTLAEGKDIQYASGTEETGD